MDTKHYEIILTDSAKQDLENIYEYIDKNLKEHNSANRLMNKIENNILILSNNPYAFLQVIVKPRNKKYRKLLIGKYIVLYRIDENRTEQRYIYLILFMEKEIILHKIYKTWGYNSICRNNSKILGYFFGKERNQIWKNYHLV